MDDPPEPRSTLIAHKVKRDIVWINVLFFIYLHLSAIYGVVLLFTNAQISTIIFTLTLILYSTISVTLGCHRLWTHKCYEANTLTKAFFLLGHTLTCQGSVYNWILDHRVHHVHHGTELDPFNHKKGFWYSQVLCRIQSDHPNLKRARCEISMADVETDNLIAYQNIFYWWILMPLIGIYLPVYIAMSYLGETFLVAMFVCFLLRIAISLHLAWLINSAINLWGLDPLNRKSADTNLIFVFDKSLWPHYHYLVTWDYLVGEYGNYGDGICNAALRVLAALGCVKNLRTIDEVGVRAAVFDSAKSKKPIEQSLLQYEFKQSFQQMIGELNKERIT